MAFNLPEQAAVFNLNCATIRRQQIAIYRQQL
jgi:hypothetical protein